ncbi:hypothetical protein ACP275_03G008700 [Erythranthe tilingii]
MTKMSLFDLSNYHHSLTCIIYLQKLICSLHNPISIEKKHIYIREVHRNGRRQQQTPPPNDTSVVIADAFAKCRPVMQLTSMQNFVFEKKKKKKKKKKNSSIWRIFKSKITFEARIWNEEDDFLYCKELSLKQKQKKRLRIHIRKNRRLVILISKVKRVVLVICHVVIKQSRQSNKSKKCGDYYIIINTRLLYYFESFINCSPR